MTTGLNLPQNHRGRGPWALVSDSLNQLANVLNNIQPGRGLDVHWTGRSLAIELTGAAASVTPWSYVTAVKSATYYTLTLRTGLLRAVDPVAATTRYFGFDNGAGGYASSATCRIPAGTANLPAVPTRYYIAVLLTDPASPLSCTFIASTALPVCNGREIRELVATYDYDGAGLLTLASQDQSSLISLTAFGDQLQ